MKDSKTICWLQVVPY